MVLVSSDPESQKRGSTEIYAAFEQLLSQYGLSEEVQLTYATDIGNSTAVPLVMIYPEAVIYGPLLVSEVPHIVEEHLYQRPHCRRKNLPRVCPFRQDRLAASPQGYLTRREPGCLKNVGLN
jgi:NADP-reducing hydrogenase subunit HndC